VRGRDARRGVEDQHVGAGAAGQHVRAAVTIEQVVAAGAVQRFGVSAAVDRVVARAALQHAVAVAALQHHVHVAVHDMDVRRRRQAEVGRVYVRHRGDELRRARAGAIGVVVERLARGVENHAIGGVVSAGRPRSRVEALVVHREIAARPDVGEDIAVERDVAVVERNIGDDVGIRRARRDIEEVNTAAERVVAEATTQRIAPGSVAAAAHQRIVAGIAKDQIIALVAVQRVVAVQPMDRVVAEAADDRVVTRGAGDVAGAEDAGRDVARRERRRAL